MYILTSIDKTNIYNIYIENIKHHVLLSYSIFDIPQTINQKKKEHIYYKIFFFHAYYNLSPTLSMRIKKWHSFQNCDFIGWRFGWLFLCPCRICWHEHVHVYVCVFVCVCVFVVTKLLPLAYHLKQNENPFWNTLMQSLTISPIYRSPYAISFSGR